jgi:hypothetical protein
MPLSPATAREPLHTRQVECRGYRRADGRWDIEGHLTDVKTYGFDNAWRGRVESGEPVHDMWLRLTVDDELLIHRVEAVTDAGPFSVCGEVTPGFAALEGLRIGPGFSRRVRELLGGVHGCTHLLELLGPIATTAFQTIYPSRHRQAKNDGWKRRPGHLDTCHALKSDGTVVKQHWPEFYTGS